MKIILQTRPDTGKRGYYLLTLDPAHCLVDPCRKPGEIFFALMLNVGPLSFSGAIWALKNIADSGHVSPALVIPPGVMKMTTLSQMPQLPDPIDSMTLIGGDDMGSLNLLLDGQEHSLVFGPKAAPEIASRSGSKIFELLNLSEGAEEPKGVRNTLSLLLGYIDGFTGQDCALDPEIFSNTHLVALGLLGHALGVPPIYPHLSHMADHVESSRYLLRELAHELRQREYLRSDRFWGCQRMFPTRALHALHDLAVPHVLEAARDGAALLRELGPRNLDSYIRRETNRIDPQRRHLREVPVSDSSLDRLSHHDRRILDRFDDAIAGIAAQQSQVR